MQTRGREELFVITPSGLSKLPTKCSAFVLFQPREDNLSSGLQSCWLLPSYHIRLCSTEMPGSTL